MVSISIKQVGITKLKYFHETEIFTGSRWKMACAKCVEDSDLIFLHVLKAFVGKNFSNLIGSTVFWIDRCNFSVDVFINVGIMSEDVKFWVNGINQIHDLLELFIISSWRVVDLFCIRWLTMKICFEIIFKKKIMKNLTGLWTISFNMTPTMSPLELTALIEQPSGILMIQKSSNSLHSPSFKE